MQKRVARIVWKGMRDERAGKEDIKWGEINVRIQRVEDDLACNEFKKDIEFDLMKLNISKVS